METVTIALIFLLAVVVSGAVAAALTGSFSVAAALGTFLWLATGGITIGWLLPGP
jgi:hypothetical protein